MNFLEKNIIACGVIKQGNILKVDNFLNHQIDIDIIRQIAHEFKRRFKGKEVTKILTIDSGVLVPTDRLARGCRQDGKDGEHQKGTIPQRQRHALPRGEGSRGGG